MRINSKALTAALAVGTVALLAGCGAGMSPARYSGSSQLDAARTGIAPRFLTMLRFGKTSAPGVNPDKAAKDLYASDYGTGAVEILKNGTYALLGSITSGLNGPDGDFADTAGNLYVANYGGVNIQEYAPGGTTPTFTYSASMVDPVGVSVDTQGNVYEADYYDGAPGFVNEYKQASNTVVATCSPGGAVAGVAVDLHDDVFVDYNTNSGGKITEYKGGLKGCKGKVLGVSFSFEGGMVIDKNRNLLVCDQIAAAVDAIAPPYTKITGTLGSGYGDPAHVTIDKKNNLAFVTDVGNANVRVLKYPSGANVATLGPANGLSDPVSAVDGLNAVY